MLAAQKYRLYLKRMSGMHPGQNGRKGSGKGSSGSQDANFQVCLCFRLDCDAQIMCTLPQSECRKGESIPSHPVMEQAHACV